MSFELRSPDYRFRGFGLGSGTRVVGEIRSCWECLIGVPREGEGRGEGFFGRREAVNFRLARQTSLVYKLQPLMQGSGPVRQKGKPCAGLTAGRTSIKEWPDYGAAVYGMHRVF